MLNDHDQQGRRSAILAILGGGVVRRQAELTQLLKKRGYPVTQSSVSRDLRELGVPLVTKQRGLTSNLVPILVS